MRLRCTKCDSIIGVEAAQVLDIGVELRPWWTHPVLADDYPEHDAYLPCPFCTRSRGGTYWLHLDALEPADEPRVREMFEDLYEDLTSAERSSFDSPRASMLRWWAVMAARVGIVLSTICATCNGDGDFLEDVPEGPVYSPCPTCAAADEEYGCGRVPFSVDVSVEAWRSLAGVGISPCISFAPSPESDLAALARTQR